MRTFNLILQTSNFEGVKLTQIAQSFKALRIPVNELWYMKNEDFHRDIGITMVKESKNR